MKCVYIEKLILTKEEFEILDKARALLDDIYMHARKDGEIEKKSCTALDEISDLLSDEYSDLE